MVRAVVFDLWNTLATWPEDDSVDFRHRWAEDLGVAVEQLDEHWYAESLYARRESGPIREAVEELYRKLGVDADVDELLDARLELTRRSLVPVDGALATLRELRRRERKIGLISNCTEEVALIWQETPFADLFDAAVFSATARCMKPSREIYELALSQLDVPASDALFVGDGANDELRGARDAGLTPLLAELDGIEPWAPVREWTGPRVTSISQVLELVD